MWDRIDQRAVVPSLSMPESRDVLFPTGSDSFSSPYPLGLGIYSCPSNTSFPKVPLPLFYVSPRVAADRAPSANKANVAGVAAGWYAVATPGRFEVRITRVNKRFPGKWPENLLTTHLFVDGTNSNDSRVFHESRQVYGESIIQGFVERMAFSPMGTVEKEVRQFEFGRAQAISRSHCTAFEDGNGDDGNVEAATICLEVMVGVGVYSDQVHPTVNVYGYEGRSGVSEKDVTKDGKSLEVKIDGHKIPEKRGACKYRAVRERPCPEGSVTVFVREFSWMRSRRLIDDNGRPCTYEAYLAMLSSEQREVETVDDDVVLLSGAGSTIRRGERRPRRRSRRPLVIDLETSSAAETEVIDVDANVIDLT